MRINIKELEQSMLQKLLQTGNMEQIINDTRWQKYINTSLVTMGIATARFIDHRKN
jgi:hypothetical protein